MGRSVSGKSSAAAHRNWPSMGKSDRYRSQHRPSRQGQDKKKILQLHSGDSCGAVNVVLSRADSATV